MLHDRQSAPNALNRFTSRYRDDAGFQDLVRNDIRAALAQAGISVPHGVNVGFAPSAAHALSMTLDNHPAVQESGNVLDDAELLEVVGGGGAHTDIQEVRNFLSLFNLRKA